MMKDIGYAGVYQSERASIGATLEDPRKFNLAVNTLVFVVSGEARGSDSVVPQPENLKFYVLDEHDQMHSTSMVRYPCETLEGKSNTVKNESVAHCTLICTELRPEFIFQSLRLVVYFKDSDEMGIIQLRH